MALSDLLSGLLTEEDSDSDSPARTTRSREHGRSTVIVYECRNCGTTVDRGTNACPNCATAEIAVYRIE